MNLNDYIIDQEGIDWSNLLSEWTWLLPTTLTPWIVNRLGDIIVVNEDETVSFFDVGCGRIKQIADSREDLIQLMDQGNNANEWLAIPLVDKLVKVGLILQLKTLYGLKLPPLLGGKYEVENIYVADIFKYYSSLGQLYGQMKDVPDGAQVIVKTINKPGSPD